MEKENFIKKARKAYGITQKQFADKFFYSQAMVSMWESGAKLPPLVRMAIKLRAEKDGVEIE